MQPTTALDDRPHSGMVPPPVGPLRTVPNHITLLRTAAAVAVGVGGIAVEDPVLLGLAYAVYWIGDVLDGWSARRLGQETRLGAVLDIVSDRACTAVLGVGLVAYHPDTAPVVLVFLLSFLVVDTMLSLAFLCWPIVSPNYFGVVDAKVYAWNWSTPAKALNTGGVVGALLLGSGVLGLVIASVVLGIKVWSVRRVLLLLQEEGR